MIDEQPLTGTLGQIDNGHQDTGPPGHRETRTPGHWVGLWFFPIHQATQPTRNINFLPIKSDNYKTSSGQTLSVQKSKFWASSEPVLSTNFCLRPNYPRAGGYWSFGQKWKIQVFLWNWNFIEIVQTSKELYLSTKRKVYSTIKRMVAIYCQTVLYGL